MCDLKHKLALSEVYSGMEMMDSLAGSWPEIRRSEGLI